MDEYTLETTTEVRQAVEEVKTVARKILGRLDILEASDIITEEVDVPEWGGIVLVRSMTGEERDSLEQSTIEGRGKNSRNNFANFRAKLVARAVVGEDGKQLFTEADVVLLGKKTVKALQRVYDKATELSAVSDDDVEELTKNSDAAQSGSSTSV